MVIGALLLAGWVVFIILVCIGIHKLRGPGAGLVDPGPPWHWDWSQPPLKWKGLSPGAERQLEELRRSGWDFDAYSDWYACLSPEAKAEHDRLLGLD